MECELKTHEIKERISQRYPFLLVDQVEEIEYGKYIRGYKNTTINEYYFQGHFPDEPIVPGVLLVESLAQLVSILVSFDNNEGDKKGYLAEIKKFRFKKKVTAGDRIDLEAGMLEKIGNIATFSVKASVKNELVGKGELTVSLK